MNELTVGKRPYAGNGYSCSEIGTSSDFVLRIMTNGLCVCVCVCVCVCGLARRGRLPVIIAVYFLRKN
jgi:hypothetical protein